MRFPFLLVGSLVIGWAASPVFADQTADSISAIQSIGPRGEGHVAAQRAAKHLASAANIDLFAILESMSQASPVGQNWLRGIVQRRADQAGAPSMQRLTAYVQASSNDPAGRATALELIRQKSPEHASKLLESCLEDPSLLIREQAIALTVARIKKMDTDDKPKQIAAYQDTLFAARHPRQVSAIIAALTELGETTTAAEAFRMLTRWHVVAPFDNREDVGFDRPDPPETHFVKNANLDLDQSYSGKHDDISWRVIESDDQEGRVDLAKAFENEKGATAYAFCEFIAGAPMPAQVRLGTMNANKVWVNGKPVMSNHVYHAGNMIDQYIADIQLRSGTNRVLIKLCQNEQTQSWAQEWEFQFRLTDRTGKGLVSKQ